MFFFNSYTILNQYITISNLLILSFISFLSIIFLSSLIIFISNKGYFGKILKNYCNYNSLFEYIVVLTIISGVINIFYLVINLYNIDFTNVCLMTDNQQDPVRWWPTGVPQTFCVIGRAALAYRGVPGSPRVKAVSAMGSLGVTVPILVFTNALENPKVYHRLLYSWIYNKNHGEFAPTIPNQINNTELEDNAISKSIENSSSLLPINNGTSIFYNFNIFYIFRPVPVEGYLDDLIGQQLFIEFLMFITVFSLIILFSLYLFIQVFLNNKEFILNKFNNKYIKYFFKYQIFLAKFSSIMLPIIIMLGLINLLVMIFYLITHPIPYEKLPIDLHILLKK